ncbi:MAG: hypothetical protein RBU36_16565 [Thermoanaerobaculia bacterium]|jgi:hypothetical protein|nr:hypothetical protein [Thermoanaerobaculia bacterium]
MLQELARESAAPGWAIASMLFFLGVWLALAVRVVRARPDALAAQARLPLADDEVASPALASEPGRGV